MTWKWVRLLGGLAILALLVWRVGSGPFLDGVRVIGIGALLAAFGIGVLTTIGSAWRWRLVAGGLGTRLPLGPAVAAYYRSQFLNTTLPGGVVGDVHRAVRHGREVGDVGLGVRAVVLERFSGQAVQVVLAAVVLTALPSPVHGRMPYVLAACALTGVLLALLVHYSPRLAGPFRMIGATVRDGLLTRRAWIGVGLASAAIVVGHGATFVLAARTAGLTASLTVLVPLTLLVLLAMAVPLNIAGWGPREGVAAWAFAAAGLTAAQGVSTAVTYGVLVLAASLPGAGVLGYQWWRQRVSPAAPDPSPAGQSVDPPADHTADQPARLSGVDRGRSPRGWVTVVAVAALVAALLLPDDRNLLSPWTFLRVPVEAVVAVALMLVLPSRARRPVALVLGGVLGLLTVVKVVDMGFLAVLDRPFDPVADWTFLGAGVNYVARAIGWPGAIALAIGAAALALAVVVLLALAAARVLPLLRPSAWRGVAVAAAAWTVLALVGAQLGPGLPIADRTTSVLAYDRVRAAGQTVHNHQTFPAEAANDAFKDVPGSRLLQGLRGKDVLLVFVESYGKVALEDPLMAPGVDKVLAAGDTGLAAAGYSARSGYLTSATYAGGSWLAHSTLQSGMWIDGQQRYNDFTASDRLTLSTAFHKAGWHTVCVSAADNGPWPEGSVYHYDDFINVDALHYQGPKFGYAGIPDQYTMSTFQQDERTPGHAPLFAEIDLMSSHSPWTPLPRSIPWSAVGDGNAYHSQITGPVSDGLGRSSAQVRTDYGKTIEYSLSTMVSYVQQYGDPNLVVVMLGDHQPAEQVSGQNASRDVPITIISQDASVMSRVDGWGWSAGLRPAPSAPVWKMDAFRDHFLSSFAR